MKTSAAGLAFLRGQEGSLPHVYQNPGDVPTVGVGHVVRAGIDVLPCTPPWPTAAELDSGRLGHDAACPGLSDGAIDALLAQDVGAAEAAIAAHVRVALTQNQFDALVSFTFNVGVAAFASSTALLRLNEGDYSGAGDALLWWDKSPDAAGDLVVNPVLSRRRAAERALFLRPVGIAVG